VSASIIWSFSTTAICAAFLRVTFAITIALHIALPYYVF